MTLTLNNKSFFLTYSQCIVPKQTLLDHLKKCFLLLARNVSKYVVAEELHEDGGQHLHAYIDLDRPYRGKVDARFLDFEAYHPNIECVRSNNAVIKYCSKENNYITNMELSKKVTKEDIARHIMSGKTLVELVTEYPKYLFGYSRLKIDIQMWRLDTTCFDSLDRTCGLWIAGPSGCGKSTIATTRLGSYYFKGPNKWWDGYNGQETVVCEDVDITWKDCFTYFKIWADRYVFNGEVKGGTISLRPKRVVVTSNKSLDELLELMRWDTNDYEPYRRRFQSYWITSIKDWEDQL